ncbi:MAG: hypothetical protein IPM69_10955 [Ignavibacteria bacterium]|nr:hypothetical protein [Ignavibacteria bacterium]
MSKGGAGKVYFVLYLAVILELLIIIVERDEAEEHLVKKQRESQKIVESILTQLQSGAGTEGINTRLQEDWVLTDGMPPEIQKEFKKFHNYTIEVGVTDVAGSDKLEGMEPKEKAERIEILKKLANVQELQYEVYYNSSKDLEPPSAPSDKAFAKVTSNPVMGDEITDANIPDAPKWVLQATRKIELNLAGMTDYKEPVYVESATKTGEINRFAPSEAVSADSVFRYSKEKTEIVSKRLNGKLNKRAFVVKFQPPSQPGWYKLRFSSRTNRILGVSGDQKHVEARDDAKVSIGTVQLKVKDLRIVQRDLQRQLEGLGLPSAMDLIEGKVDGEKFIQDIATAKAKVANDNEKRGKVDLYGYIARLLAPGGSLTFEQNKGSIEVDILVHQPKIEQEGPVLTWDDDQLYSFDKATKTVATFTANLFDKVTPTVTFNGKPVTVTKQNATDATGRVGKFKVEINEPIGEGQYALTASHTSGGKTISPVCSLTVFQTGLATVKDAEGQDIRNKDEIIGSIEGVSYGDALQFEAIPTSGSKIPGNQFRIFVEGTTNKQPANRLSIASSDNYVVPVSSEKISVRIVWQSPKDQDIKVQLFPDGNGPFETKPTQRKPSINLPGITVSPMTDPRDPTIVVQNIEIKAPTSGAAEGAGEIDQKAQVVGVKIEVVESTIKGYSVQVIGEPQKNGAKYNVTLRLKGPVPVPRGTKGTIKLKIKASAQHPNGEKSKEAVKPYNFPFSF